MGGNYAGGFLATKTAKELSANEALYLDAATRTYLEEAGSANIVISLSGNFVSLRLFPLRFCLSITRRSVMQIAER